ncbi:hypothetical protein TNCV_2989561 [Trichonephila clavipes]|nr:hypothetical protein TNCV_2989561 [Trichonephila clavipes]
MEQFYECLAGRYAPDLRIGRRKCTSRENIASGKVSSERCIGPNFYKNWCEYGSLSGNMHCKGGPRLTRTSSLDLNVLDTIRRNPSTSVLPQENFGVVFIVFSNVKVDNYTHTIFKEYRCKLTYIRRSGASLCGHLS